jgi:hypothetical protein
MEITRVSKPPKKKKKKKTNNKKIKEKNIPSSTTCH